MITKTYIKICSKCKNQKTTDAFYSNAAQKDGLSNQCRSCMKVGYKAYYEKNKERVLAKNAVWYAANPGSNLKNAAVYRGRYPDRVAVAQQKYLTKYPERRKASFKKYQKANMPMLMAKRRKRYATDLNFRIKCCLRAGVTGALHDNYKSGSAISLLGCSIDNLKKHLEAKFKPGMSWDNYGYDGWHIDHKKPLAWFALSDSQELAEACHYTNLQPLWQQENFGKGARYAA